MTIAAVSVAAASAVAGYQEQVEQTEAAQEAFYQNQENARAEERDQLRSIQANLDAEETAANDQKRTNQLEAMRAASAQTVKAGETGGSGNTMAALVQDIQRQNASRNLTIDRNMNYARMGAQSEARTANLNKQTRINSVAKPRFSQGRALLTAGLSGASTGASLYAAGQ